MAEEFDILGKRILCEGFYGTVRYCGQVPPTTGEWYGIDWDEPQRGKHDGSMDGFKYFDCSHPTSGSFVRAKKLNFGVSVVQALRERYGQQSDPATPGDDMYVRGTRKTKVAVEMVGAESVQKKLSCFARLQDVVLRGEAVSHADKVTRLHEIAPNIRELDLSKNLLSKWKDVADITNNMENLKTLILSENSLILPEEPEQLVSSFCTVTELYLTSMKLKWCKVALIVQMFPNLEELHLRNNNINCLRIDGDETGSVLLSRFRNIKTLNLDKNQLSDWNEVLRLGPLQQLSSLILNNNKITEIRFDVKTGNGCKSTVFTSLTSLVLCSTNINDISSINALNQLPSLIKLQFKDNPLFKDETSFVSRQELIARIATLQTVNNSPVTVKECQAAERAYIKTYARDWANAGGSISGVDSNKLSPEFVHKHPRYVELIKVHGSPEVEQLPKASHTLKDSLITITIKCPDAPDKKSVSKKLPGTMTIGKVKGLLYRLYKVDSSDQKLSYLDTKNDREIPLDDDLRQISFYSVVSGDTVFVRW